MPLAYEDDNIKVFKFSSGLNLSELDPEHHYSIFTNKKVNLETLKRSVQEMPSPSELERKEQYTCPKEIFAELRAVAQENIEEEGSTITYEEPKAKVEESFSTVFPTACGSSNMGCIGSYEHSFPTMFPVENTLPGDFRPHPMVKDNFGQPFYRNYAGIPVPHLPPEEETALQKELMKGGYKADTGKPRFDLLPPEVMEGYARALEYGARKYSERNYEKGMNWGRVFGAAMRHMWAFWRGEEFDKESGLHHLESALFSIGALYVYTKRKIGKDDRVK